MRTLKGVNVKGKTVLLRADLDVPLKNSKVADDERFRAALPTIQYLVKQKAKIIICGHLGRPEGEKVSSLSLRPVAKRLSKLLNKPVKFVTDCIGHKAESTAANLKDGEIIMLENARFHPEEEQDEKKFAKKLAGLADIFVHDAFASHRNHASTHAVANYLPSYAGLLVEKEVKILEKILKNPQKPFVIVLGGAKTGTKIDLLDNLPKWASKVLVGGAMAFTFLKAQGYDVGKSKYEANKVKTASRIIAKLGKKLVLPADFIIESGENVRITDFNLKMTGFDIGKQTNDEFVRVIRKAKTVFWNGPMGLFEKKQFMKGTEAIAEAIVKCKTSIAGGGDTEHAIKNLGLMKRFTHISTGGGAALNILAGKKISATEIK